MSRLFLTPEGKLLLQGKREVLQFIPEQNRYMHVYKALDELGVFSWIASPMWPMYTELTDAEQADFEARPVVAEAIQRHRAEAEKSPLAGVFICGGRRTREYCSTPGCSARSEALCDWPVTRKGKPATCDAKMCEGHRRPVPGEKDRDWCAAHWKLYES